MFSSLKSCMARPSCRASEAFGKVKLLRSTLINKTGPKFSELKGISSSSGDVNFIGAARRRRFAPMGFYADRDRSTSIAKKYSLSFSLSSTAMPASEDFQKLQIARDDTTFDAYVVGKENAPGIVVLQEWWGVDFEVKNHAQKIAQLGTGYRALIPDLYRGKVGLDVAEAQHLMEGLDWQGAVKDIAASIKWLKANGSPKVGVTGYCMGGALSIASGVLIPEVDAVVSFYGVPSPELADPSQAKAPVQAHFGELDSFVGFSDITAAKSLEEKLKASGVPYEVHIYPGLGHAFMNTSPEGMSRRKAMGLLDEDFAAAELAWSRFSSWMGKYLSPISSI